MARRSFCVAAATLAPLLQRLQYLSTPKTHLPIPFPSSSKPFSPLSSSVPRSLSSNSFSNQYNNCQTSDSDFEEEPSSGTINSSQTQDFNSLLNVLSEVRNLPSEKDGMDAMERSGIVPTEDLVYGTMSSLKDDWELSLLVFQWGVSGIGYTGLGSNARHLVIWVLGKHGKFDIAWSLINRFHEHSLVTSETLLVMIKRYAAANQADKAIKTFHAMEKFDITPDDNTYFTLLRTLCKHKDIEETEEVIFLNKAYFPLETRLFNILLEGWCSVMVDVVEAKRIWRKMSNYCIFPDAMSYTYMIHCFSLQGNLFDSLRLYDEMKKRGWVPSKAVYDSLVYVLAKVDRVEKALNFLNTMKEKNMQPDLTTYNSLIVALCENEKTSDAYSVLDKMILRGIKPMIETYNSLMKIANMRVTLSLIERMKSNGCSPNLETYLHIFLNCFRLKQPGNAVVMWMNMKRSALVPNSAHFSAMVNGLLTFGRYSKAIELVREMRVRGFAVEPKTELMLKELKLDTNKKSARETRI